MKDNKLVSIITPCYNAQKYLDQFFDSIIRQTYRPLELIIVNDGSNDETDVRIKINIPNLDKHGIKTIYKSYEKNQGQAYALNEGLKQYSGNYLTWIDIDDEMTVDCIEQKVKYLEDHPAIDYCVCNTDFFEAESHEYIRTVKPAILYDQKKIFESLVFNKDGYYVCGAYMVRSRFFDSHVKNRDIYTGRGGQNAQMLIPCAWFGKIGYINESLYKYYIYSHSHSHGKNTPEKQIKQLENFEKIILNTVERLQDNEANQYIEQIKKRFARARFGYALDTYDPSIIRQSAAELKAVNEMNNHDRYLVVRFANPIVKRLFPIQKQENKG